jgi:hypothetical protein
MLGFLVGCRGGVGSMHSHFCDDTKRKASTTLNAELLEMRAGSTTTILSRRRLAKNGAIPAQQTPKNFARRHLRENWWWRYSGITKGHLQSSTPPRGPQSPVTRTATSRGIIWGQPSDQNIFDCSVMVSCCCMTRLGHGYCPCWELRRSRAFIPPYLHDFHILGPLKDALDRKTFRSDEEVQEAVHEWLPMQTTDFFFMRNPGVSEVLDDMHWTQWGQCWKTTKLHRTYLH